MSVRQKVHVPSYRLHKQSGQAIVTLPDGFGGRREFLLGVHDTEESKTEYTRLLHEWQSNDRRAPQDTPADLTIAELNRPVLAALQDLLPPPGRIGDAGSCRHDVHAATAELPARQDAH